LPSATIFNFLLGDTKKSRYSSYIGEAKEMIKHLTQKTYEEEVLKSKVPVVVDFWASWCGPCKMQGGILEQLDKEFSADKVKICKVNVDEEGELAQTFGVQSIPTMLFYKDGKITNKAVGVRDADALKKLLGL
jgi:thioredoxin 1